MSKEISFGNEARLKIKEGIDKAAKCVAPTLGAIGMACAIDYEGLDPVIADDGVTILKNLDFKNKYENIGLKMLRKGALRTSTEGGDGTATTTVLTQALVAECFKEIANDSSKIQEVRERLSKGLIDVLAELTKIKREVKDEDIERIATISSLDPEIAKLIADTIKQIGVNGLITVEKGSKIGYSSEVVKGARFNSGLLAPYFVNEFEKELCVLENPYICLIDRKVSANEQISSIMKSLNKGDNILFIADDIDSIAMATLIQNNNTVATIGKDGQQKQGLYGIACVKNPYNGTRAKDFLFDIASLTGAVVLSEEAGMKLSESTVAQCGKSTKVIVSKDKCTIVGGQSTEALQERIRVIESKISETISEYEKEMLEERLASLTGGIGIIKVGTYTDTDFNAKKLKFDNAINSTLAALQEGILPGGGTSTFEVSKMNIDPLFKKVLSKPIVQMAINAGIYKNFWFYKLLFHNKRLLNKVNKEIGYNFKNRKLVNMFDAGIIDPFKVTRLALESAVNIADTLVKIEPAIVNEIENVK
jgi:chaperonin GroEL